MQDEDHGIGIRDMMVDAPFILHACKAPTLHCFMESLIPDSAGLFYAIDALGQFHYPVLFPRFFESGWLLHVRNLVRG
jgi:hypothetical protein